MVVMLFDVRHEPVLVRGELRCQRCGQLWPCRSELDR